MTHPKIILLAGLVMLLCYSCSSNQKSQDTVKIEKIALEDGWYGIDSSGQGINKDFTGDTINLAKEPFLPLKQVTSITSELDADLDTALVIRFRTSDVGKEKWNDFINSYKRREVYFLLDDTLINIFNLSTNPKDNVLSNFQLKLGYSDFPASEAKRIEEKMRQRIDN